MNRTDEETKWIVRSKHNGSIAARCATERDAILWAASPLTQGSYPSGVTIEPPTPTQSAARDAGQHTPGPWEVRAKGVALDGSDAGTYIGQVGGGLIARTFTNKSNMQPDECLAAAQADARLIAAAPETARKLAEVTAQRDALMAECKRLRVALSAEGRNHLFTRLQETMEALRLIARSDSFNGGSWLGEVQGIARTAIAVPWAPDPDELAEQQFQVDQDESGRAQVIVTAACGHSAPPDEIDERGNCVNCGEVAK